MIRREDALILDGATGTELIARGFRADPVLWTARAGLDAPALLKKIHLEYLEAGADIITAHTFRASAYAAAKAGLGADEARRLTAAALAAAAEAIAAGGGGTPRLLAGSLGPLEDCYAPAATPPTAVLEKTHAETARWLVEGGCQLILAETMGTAREALVAVACARRAGANAAVSFITDASGTRLLGGDPLRAAARDCVAAGTRWLLINCVHAEVVERALAELKESAGPEVWLGAYANASKMQIDAHGSPRWEADPRPEEERAREYAGRAATWVERFGVRIIGSCCGTTPAWTRALAHALR